MADARELAEQIAAFTERDDWRDAVAKDLARLVRDELLPALEAAHSHIFLPHRPGDIKPYRLVQERFSALGFEIDVDTISLARVGDTPQETQ